MPSPDPIYNETLAEVSRDVEVPEDQLRQMMARYLASAQPSPDLTREEQLLCYAIYRIVKLKGAFEGATSSRTRWKKRAEEAGWTLES